MTQEVSQALEYGIEIRKNSLVLDESELRKVTNLKRLNKSLTNPMAQAGTPGPDGPERVFFFKSPDRPFREALIVTLHSFQRNAVRMPTDKQYYEGQADNVFQQYLPLSSRIQAC